MKLTQELSTKDTIIEGKSIEIDKLSKHAKGLSDQLATIKAGAQERASHLEREIQILKSELEEGKISKVRELESQRSSMQRDIDLINRSIEEKDIKVNALNSTLGQIKSDQENESVNLGIFITKSINTISIAANASQESGNTGLFIIESQQDVGFANMRIKTAVNGDITGLLKI